MRFSLSIGLLAVCLIALQCTATASIDDSVSVPPPAKNSNPGTGLVVAESSAAESSAQDTTAANASPVILLSPPAGNRAPPSDSVDESIANGIGGTDVAESTANQQVSDDKDTNQPHMGTEEEKKNNTHNLGTGGSVSGPDTSKVNDTVNHESTDGGTGGSQTNTNDGGPPANKSTTNDGNTGNTGTGTGTNDSISGTGVDKSSVISTDPGTVPRTVDAVNASTAVGSVDNSINSVAHTSTGSSCASQTSDGGCITKNPTAPSSDTKSLNATFPNFKRDVDRTIAVDSENKQNKSNQGDENQTNDLKRNVNGKNLPISSSMPLSQPKQQNNNLATNGGTKKRPKGNTTTSKEVLPENNQPSNHKPGTGVQENSNTTIGTKKGTEVHTSKDAKDTSKAKPVVTVDTESNTTPTEATKTAGDNEPKVNTKMTVTPLTPPLSTQTKVLRQMETLNINDVSSSASLLLAFATLATLAVTSVVPGS